MTRDVGISVSGRHPDVTALFAAFPTEYSASQTSRLQHLDGERSRTCQHLSSFNCQNCLLANRLLDTALVTRPKYPPYRETGIAIPLSHCVSCDIADYRCCTPTSFSKGGLSHSKDRPNKGGITEKAKLPLNPIALQERRTK